MPKRLRVTYPTTNLQTINKPYASTTHDSISYSAPTWRVGRLSKQLFRSVLSSIAAIIPIRHSIRARITLLIILTKSPRPSR